MRNTPDARFMWSGRAGIWVTAPAPADGRGRGGSQTLRVTSEAIGTSDDVVTEGRASEVEQLDHLESS